jgi:glycosyltransferase involved in cell wall biosynthesis
MAESKYVASFSVFSGKFFGHGGEKRTKQLEALVEEKFNYQLVQSPSVFNSIKPISVRSKIRRVGYIPKVLFSFRNNKNFRFNTILEEGYKFFRQETFLDSKRNLFAHADTILWENNFPAFSYMLYLLKHKYSKKVVACPHNLESLVPLQKLRWHGKKNIQFLDQELEALSMCDEVFAISEEEQWLLNLFGIKARYLPYYPVGELFSLLKELRKYREENAKESFFLIIGSITNPPTRAGMITLLKQIKKIGTENHIDYRFKVTGYGTEQLSSEFNSGCIDILGYTEDHVLHELMKKCKSMILYQGYSTGALTRIPEMLVAGIPVISDDGGARSYRRMEGMHIYNNLNDLVELVHSDFSLPALPARPDKLFSDFVQTL